MRNREARDLVNALVLDPSARTRQSLERRWSSAALRSAVRARAVTELLPSIYVGTEHHESFYSRACAATLWVGRGSVLVGEGAAFAWGLVDLPPSRVVVSGPYGAKPSTPDWLALRRVREPIPQADWRRCPVATPAFVAVTCCELLSSRDTASIVYRAVQMRLTNVGELAQAVDFFPRLRGRAALERALVSASQGCESHLEEVGLRTVLHGSQFADLILQHRVVTGGRHFRLDAFDPGTRTAFEFDGSAFHDAPHQVASDRWRDAELAAAGILTVRFSYRDVTERPEWCRRVALQAMSRRTTGPT